MIRLSEEERNYSPDLIALEIDNRAQMAKILLEELKRDYYVIPKKKGGQNESEQGVNLR